MTIQSINARNQFQGKIREIIEGPVVSEVDVDTPFGIVTSVITTREAAFARLESRVLKRLMTVEAINNRNQIRGRIADIVLDTVLSEVRIATDFGLVTSTVLTRSLSEQPLEVGAEVLATFKSNEVVLAV